MPLGSGDEDLPFAPGMSPFHIKGIAYRGHIEYVEKHIPGGAAAVNRVFRNSALRFFFEQPFLAASWYDVLPIVPLWYACADVLGRPRLEFLRTRTRHQAEQDIHGVYRMILKLASPQSVAERIQRVVGKYFDFGTTDAKLIEPGLVRYVQKGVPAFLAPWFGIVGETFVQVALEIAGTNKCQVRRAPPATTGTAHGVPLVSLSVDVALGGGVPETA
jgi:hypothetical protein